MEGRCRGSCNGLMYEERLRLSVVLHVITTGRCMPHATSSCAFASYQAPFVCDKVSHTSTCIIAWNTQFSHDQACFQACLSTELQVDCEVWPAMLAQTDIRLSSRPHKSLSEQAGAACGASSAEVAHSRLNDELEDLPWIRQSALPREPSMMCPTGVARPVLQAE